MTAGQQMILIAAAAWPLTFHATTMNITGGVSYTCAAGDRLYVVKDDDDVIRVSVNKQDGTSVVPGAAASVAVGNITGAGTGVLTALAVNVGSAGAPVVLNGALGTPSGGTATNVTGLPLTTGVTGTLPIANGGTNSTATTYCSLTANVSGVLPNANGGSGAITPLLKGVGYTAINRDYIIATAASITITLPSSPTAGDTVTIKDGTGAAATSSFTVGRNGSNIASDASDLTFDQNWVEVVLTYIDGSIGWSV